jgi:DNA replication protein DnaC
MRKQQVRKNPRETSLTPKQDDNTSKSLELSEGQLEVHFRRLNLAHTRRIYKEVAVRAEKESWSYRDFLALLLAEEVARRKQTRLQRCTRGAHFPFFKTIDEFDFTLQSTLRESVIGSYLGLDFVTEGRSLILHGKTGRGKTHLAVAIGYRAIQNGFETLFTTAAELIEDLSNASKRGNLQESLTTYTHPHVLVIDEVGYLTYGPDAANVLFHVVNDRHLRKRPMIFTTNKPLNEWGKVLHDEDMAAAILDRVLERGRFIHLDGPSGRTRHLNLEEILPAGADRARISGINAPEFPEPTKSMGRKSITVLLVGETARSSLELLLWLYKRGCRCHFATSYRDACSLISRTQFDLVLSQYQLPDRTVFPLLDWLEGSSATLFFSTLVEDGSLWLKMLDRGRRCVGAPLVRSEDLTRVIGALLGAGVEPSKKERVGAG